MEHICQNYCDDALAIYADISAVRKHQCGMYHRSREFDFPDELQPRLPGAASAKANTPFDTPVGDVRHAKSIQLTEMAEVDVAIMAVRILQRMGQRWRAHG